MAKFNPMDMLMGAAMHANPVVGMIGGIVANAVASTPAAQVPPGRSPAVIAEKVMTDVHAKLVDANAAIVPVKSAWFSKINWVAIAPFAASVLAAWGLNVSADDLVKIVVGVQAIQTLLTIIIRTFFTRSVTRASVGG